jgi:hypothetical protein
MTRSPLAIVVGYEDHIEAVGLPDPNDRHIVAAGIAAGAAVILTWNLRHFSAAALKRFVFAERLLTPSFPISTTTIPK